MTWQNLYLFICHNSYFGTAFTSAIDFVLGFEICPQWWCKPNAENLFFAEVQPTFALFSVAKLMKKTIVWKEICKKVTNEL